MLKKIFGILIISLQLMVPVSGCDQDDLNSKTGDLSGKIYKAQPISKEIIMEDLGFVYDEDGIRAKYKKPSEFQAIWSQKTSAISSNTHFLRFADLCREIYDEGNPVEKSSIHMLFERVSNKVQDFLALQQRRSTVPDMSPETLKQKVQEFLNIDRVDLPISGGSIIETH